MGKLTQFVTFEIELLLMTGVISATTMFMSSYFNSTLKVPPLVFMFLGSVCAMAVTTLVAQMVVFSLHTTSRGGPVGNTVLSEVSQGFAVVSLFMWIGMTLLMFIDVPRITSIPDHEPAASLVAVSIVIGFTIFIPFLALVVCYTALPEDENSSLVFNGSSIGVFSLLFFVLISFGSGGVTKCEPFDQSFSSMMFIILVWTYFGLLYLIEVANFKKRNPLAGLFSGDGATASNADTSSNDFSGGISFNFWRIPGAVLNGVIIISTLAFSSSAVHGIVAVVFIVVLCMHVPLLISITLSTTTVETAIPADYSDETIDNNGYGVIPSFPPMDQTNQIQGGGAWDPNGQGQYMEGYSPDAAQYAQYDQRQYAQYDPGQYAQNDPGQYAQYNQGQNAQYGPDQNVQDGQGQNVQGSQVPSMDQYQQFTPQIYTQPGQQSSEEIATAPPLSSVGAVFPANVPHHAFFGSNRPNGVLEMKLNNVGPGQGRASTAKPSTSRQRRSGHHSDIFG